MFKKICMKAELVFLAASSLFSLDCAADGNFGSPFCLDPVLDTSVIAAAAGLNGAVLYLDKVREVNQPGFEGKIYDPFEVNGFDRLFMKPYSSSIDDLGTYMGLVSVLSPTVLLAAPSDQWITIGTMYAETIALAYGFKELGKLCIGRARPFMYYDDYPKEAVQSHDWNKSFPSGHTTLAFAGASFTSYVFSKYFPDSSWKIPVIGSSFFMALSTAACRVASGDHFPTDVIAGAAAGTACGILVPWIHTRIVKNSKSDDDGLADIAVQAMPASLFISMKY